MLEIPLGTQALLFDCDGTLADTMSLHFDAWHETLLRYGVDCPRSFIDTHAGVPTDLIVVEVNRDFGVALSPELVAQEKDALFHERMHLAQPVEEVVATARAYHGKLPLAVVSGGVLPSVLGVLEGIGIAKLFDTMVTASDPVPPKPSPDIYLEAARRLKVEPARCHVFEDGEPGFVAAQRAGMTFTDVRRYTANNVA